MTCVNPNCDEHGKKGRSVRQRLETNRQFLDFVRILAVNVHASLLASQGLPLGLMQDLGEEILAGNADTDLIVRGLKGGLQKMLMTSG